MRPTEATAVEKKPTAVDQRWTVKVGDPCAVEILADVLARHAGLIPDLLRATGNADFYPPFLAHLLETVTETAQPRYRPKTYSERARWGPLASVHPRRASSSRSSAIDTQKSPLCSHKPGAGGRRRSRPERVRHRRVAADPTTAP